ncbi:MAG: hypothetical protein RR640_04315 [Oscillospiraceae bacterium]
MEKEKNLTKTKRLRIEKIVYVIGFVLCIYFILMVFLAAFACMQNSITKQKTMGYFLLSSVILFVFSIALMMFKKRLLASILSILGWGATLYIGISLSSSTFVGALQELPADKFFLCHILPVFIPIYCIGFFIYYKLKQRKEDYTFFLQKQKLTEEKYKSILK